MAEESVTRESTKQATRLALVHAAMAEFAAKGFDAPSLDAICARAGYTRGAFYVHFNNRDELVVAVMEHALHAFLDTVIASGDAEDDLETTVKRFIAIALRPVGDPGEAKDVHQQIFGPPFHQLLEASRRSTQVRGAFVEILQEAIGRVATAARAGLEVGRLRSDVAPEEMARILILLALGVRTVTDVGLPIDLEGTRDAALKLLRTEGLSD